jgi:uncharacterized membrane protein YqaE (UPF0057 family)
MLYLLCIIFPPLAVLLAGKPIQALINLVLCLFFWIPGCVHAFMVVVERKADKRAEKTAKMIAAANKKD